MLLIPVMDLKSGQSVYTHHNDNGNSLVSEDPLEAAERWVSAGAKRIHIVDVDSYRAKQPVNSHLVAEIHRHYPQLEFQVGGISREEDILIWSDAGVKYMVLNSRAISRNGFIFDMCVEFSGSIMVALDSQNGEVRYKGHETHHDLNDLAKELEDEGVAGIVLTDIPEVGHVNGSNIKSSCRLADHISIPVIANGGVNCLEDLQTLDKIDEHRLSGIIIGRPLHDQQLDFRTAQNCVVNL